MKTPSTKQISQVMSHLGAKGTGLAKVRGNSQYYSALSKKRKSKKDK